VAGEPVLRAEGLRLAYGPRTVVEDLTLEVGPGECVALIGANGAGKSTTLKAIAGLHPLRAGRIVLRGDVVGGWTGPRAVASGVVLCPEGRHLFPRMSVRDNLLLGLGVKRTAAAERAERLEEVESLFPVLRDRKAQLAGTLSGGEQQMVALGRALMSHPRLMILDEPSLGLSPLLVEQVFGAISALVGEERSVLLAEQNVEASLAIAGRAYILESGRVTREGGAAELLGSRDLIAAFLG
jgi:branched-chain amino acid transport system ATP-binding protein